MNAKDTGKRRKRRLHGQWWEKTSLICLNNFRDGMRSNDLPPCQRARLGQFIHSIEQSRRRHA